MLHSGALLMWSAVPSCGGSQQATMDMGCLCSKAHPAPQSMQVLWGRQPGLLNCEWGLSASLPLRRALVVLKWSGSLLYLEGKCRPLTRHFSGFQTTWNTPEETQEYHLCHAFSSVCIQAIVSMYMRASPSAKPSDLTILLSKTVVTNG